MRRIAFLSFVALIGSMVWYGLLDGGAAANRGVGIVPWAQSQTQMESNEQIRRNRLGPMVCTTYYDRPIWRRMIQRTDSWCVDWLEDQEILARGR